MKDTSLQALQEVTATGSAESQARQILQGLAVLGAATGQEVAAQAQLSNHVVTKRRGALLRAGVVEEMAARTCKVTGRQAHPIRLTDLGVGVASGGDMPRPGPSLRDHELAVLKEAQAFAMVWGTLAEQSPAQKRLCDAVWRLTHHQDRLRGGKAAIREPWGSPRRAALADMGVWLRRNGDQCYVGDMNDHHLLASIAWCKEHGADQATGPLAMLLWEALRRGLGVPVE